MATFTLIHGAGSDGWYWHLVEPELKQRGHDVVTMDLPCDDDSAGLDEYVDVVVDAIGDRRDDLVLVAQSLAGFTAPLVAQRPADTPHRSGGGDGAPGESLGDWWANTGHVFPEPFDPMEVFMHDVPADLAAASGDHAAELAARLHAYWTDADREWKSGGR